MIALTFGEMSKMWWRPDEKAKLPSKITKVGSK